MTRIDPSMPAPAFSILDRLLGEPSAVGTNVEIENARRGEPSSGPSGWKQGLRSVKSAVVRDLEWLFNCRAPGDPDEAVDSNATLLGYGLPDLTLLDLRDSVDRAKLEVQIAAAIERHETRLKDVVVDFRGSEGTHGGTRFHVEGTLMIEPQAVELSFDTTVKWLNRRIEVQGEGA